jgi:endonuclease-3 related protein
MSAVLRAMLDQFGPQHWWPGQTPFEIAVGAILTQNTNWQKVTRAIENLRGHGALEPQAMDRLPLDALGEMIRPAGYFRQKAARLKSLVRWLIERHDGSMQPLAAADLGSLREQLLAIRGIGPETADAILLYAAGQPTFVVDTYTHRIATRHGWIEPEAGYDELKEYFQSRLPDDVAQLQEMHAQLVQVGKQYCRRREARCEHCPLRAFLPDSGPIAAGE